MELDYDTIRLREKDAEISRLTARVKELEVNLLDARQGHAMGLDRIAMQEALLADMKKAGEAMRDYLAEEYRDDPSNYFFKPWVDAWEAVKRMEDK